MAPLYLFFYSPQDRERGRSLTGELGARLDFEKILLGQTLWIANVEIVPLVPAETTLYTRLLDNAGRLTQSVEFPTRKAHLDVASSTIHFPMALQ